MKTVGELVQALLKLNQDAQIELTDGHRGFEIECIDDNSGYPPGFPELEGKVQLIFDNVDSIYNQEG